MLDRLLGAPFELGSRLRDARVFHPRGVVVGATWDPNPALFPGSPLTRAPQPALVRVSHAVGLPPGVPDILGMAIRVVDAHGAGRHQDLLLASSGTGSVTRHLLRPASAVTGTLVSSLLPYEVAGLGRHPIVAHTVGADRTITYPEVLHDPTALLPDIEVLVGSPERPRLATVHTAERVPDTAAEPLRFNPWNTGPELRPTGLLNRLRRPSYRASQEGRGAA